MPTRHLTLDDITDGLERHVVVELAGGRRVRSEPEAQHARQLTDHALTPSVNYVRFGLTPDEVDAVATAGVVVAIDHPNYAERVQLAVDAVTELLSDLRRA